MEWASIIISVLALLGAAYTYFVHDCKIKRQEAKINEYQLAKIMEEEEENKKAQICGNIVKLDKGKRVLKIYNKGKAPAFNIRVDGLDENKISVYGLKMLPFERLNPQESFELNLLSPGWTITLKIKYIWNDASQNNKEFEQILQLT